MKRMDSLEVLRDFIMNDLRWDGERQELTPDFPLIDGDVLDSMELFSLVAFIEGHFGIEVRDEELVPGNFGTLSAIAALIEQKQTSTGNA